MRPPGLSQGHPVPRGNQGHPPMGPPRPPQGPPRHQPNTRVPGHLSIVPPGPPPIRPPGHPPMGPPGPPPRPPGGPSGVGHSRPPGGPPRHPPSRQPGPPRGLPGAPSLGPLGTRPLMTAGPQQGFPQRHSGTCVKMYVCKVPYYFSQKCFDLQWLFLGTAIPPPMLIPQLIPRPVAPQVMPVPVVSKRYWNW